MRLASLTVLGALLAGMQAHATTVQEGIESCQAAFKDEPTWQDAASASLCLGVADGVARIMTLNCFSVSDGAKPEVYLSAEPPPSTKTAVQAFLNWANDNPQKWAEEFNLGMMDAMSSTFPCMALGK